MKNHFKFLTFVLIAFVHGQILAAPAVFFNDNLTAGRTSFTNTVNSATAVGGGTPIIYIVDIGAQAGQSNFTATSSSGPTIYVSTSRLGSPASNNNTGDIGGLGYTTWSVSYTSGNFSSVIDRGYKVSFFSDSARTTPVDINAIGIQTTNWGTCCTGNNTTPDGSLQPGSAIYMNFAGATSGNLLVGNITSSISGTEHFVGAINDTAFFNTMTLAPNGTGEFFGVGSYLMFSTVALGSVPAGSSVVTVGTTSTSSSITDIITPGTFLLSSVVTGFNPIFDSGTLTVANGDSSSQTFTIRSTGGTITIASGTATLSGVISDYTANANGGLIKTGAGILILSGANTYTGGTTVSAGTLQISADNNLGAASGGITLSGGKLLVANTISTARNIVLSTGSTSSIEASSGETYAINGIISGSGSVNFTGGSVSLTAANTFSGSAGISGAATLALINAATIANASAVTVTNGTFDISGANGNINLGGTYTQGSNGNLSMGFAPVDNQRLVIAGAATLAGGLTINGSAGAYRPGRYTLITGNSLSGTFGSLTTDLPSFTRLDYGLAYDALNVYLILNPDLADTQQSLVNTASVLQGTFTLQNSVMVNGFTYDCPVFDKDGVCVSVGGRNTTVQAQGINNTSGLLIASYRLDKNNSRIGAWIDQNLSVSGPGTVQLGNSTPMMGIFGVWSERPDDLGAEVKIGAAYGQKDVTVTRQIVGTSEPGTGGSQLVTQGVQLTAKYGFGLPGSFIVSPYAGMRYAQNNMGGYTEATSAAVFAPLTYSALNTNATTALAGAEIKYKGIINTTLFASGGVETDTNTSNGTYSATGLNGLTPVNFNPNPVKTRPTATLGGYYDITKSQRFGVTGIYRQEPFQAVSTTTVIATYTIGL
jgi:autotransporter-associated beta strand protein